MEDAHLERNYKISIKRVSKKLRSLRIHSIKAEEIVNKAYITLAESGKPMDFLGSRSEFELIDTIRKEAGRTTLQRKKKKKARFDSVSSSLTYTPFQEKSITDDDMEFLIKQYNLSDKEAEIIRFRSDGKTLLEIGNILGVSETRIWQITKKISENVKKGMGWLK